MTPLRREAKAKQPTASVRARAGWVVAAAAAAACARREGPYPTGWDRSGLSITETGGAGDGVVLTKTDRCKMHAAAPACCVLAVGGRTAGRQAGGQASRRAEHRPAAGSSGRAGEWLVGCTRGAATMRGLGCAGRGGGSVSGASERALA